MVRIDVEIPDALYLEATRVADENQMTFVEVVRYGLELIVSDCRPKRYARSEWTLPSAADLGAPLAAEEQWSELCRD
jgi:hypothetical protein